MANSGLKDVIEELAEAIVLANPEDLRGLAEIHRKFDPIARQDDASNPVPAAAARACMKLLESVVLEEATDPHAALSLVGRSIAALQQALCEGRPVPDCSWPAELELPVGDLDRSATPDSAPPQDSQSCDSNAADSTPKSAVVPPAISDTALLLEFVGEATEHLANAEVQLLQLETDPHNAEAIAAVFRAFHTIKGVAGFLDLADIVAVAHEAENLLDRVRSGELVVSGPMIDVSFEAIDALKQRVQAWREFTATGSVPELTASTDALLARLRNAGTGAEPPAPPKKLGEILVATGKVAVDKLDSALEKQQKQSADKLGEILVAEKAVTAKDVAQALRTQRTREEQSTNAAGSEPVKVDARRLDALVDGIGELVIAVSMVKQSTAQQGRRETEFSRQVSQLDKITRGLQTMAMSLRMVPIRPVFQKMQRLARDVSKKLGKPVDLVTFGEDTELDKSVIDRLADPLVHMVRNAIDHGLESTLDERRRLDKPETGRIELKAGHEGGNIHIQVIDDGRGLDRDAILTKARQRGLVPDGETPSDNDLFSLIFMPGFSTAKTVTDVSGRGVGLDVVRRNLETLRGRIEIRSKPGQGTQFTIILPLTLAIIDGMVIRVGSERFILPTLSIVSSLRPQRSALSSVLGRREMLRFQGALLPLVRLSQLFNIGEAQERATDGIVVVVEHASRRVALLVDELVGQQQIVIKPLGAALGSVKTVAGGAILPNGSVGLILDVVSLIKVSDEELHEKPLADSAEPFASTAIAALAATR